MNIYEKVSIYVLIAIIIVMVVVMLLLKMPKIVLIVYLLITKYLLTIKHARLNSLIIKTDHNVVTPLRFSLMLQGLFLFSINQIIRLLHKMRIKRKEK